MEGNIGILIRCYEDEKGWPVRWINIGTCEIVFDLSGPGAEKVHRIYVSGNEVRQMAGRVIEECIEPGGERSGAGFVTKNFENLFSSIATPGNHFFENPRKLDYFSFFPSYPPLSQIWNTSSFLAPLSLS